MSISRSVIFVRLLVALLSLGTSSALLRGQTAGAPEHYTASAIDVNSGATGRIEIDVSRWSTNAETKQLATVLFKQGSEKLLDQLREMKPVGRIYTTGTVGWDLRYAQQRPLPDGGREITLATDRPMSFWEASNKRDRRSIRSRGLA